MTTPFLCIWESAHQPARLGLYNLDAARAAQFPLPLHIAVAYCRSQLHPLHYACPHFPGRPVVKAGKEGIEIKTTRKAGGAVDTHGARDQWMCVFVYDLDTETEPAAKRGPMTFTEVYLGTVTVQDFRRNPRGQLGTRTATLHKDGIQKLRANWIYRL